MPNDPGSAKLSQRVVVTGGASGLGRAAARRLARDPGSSVALLDIDDDGGRAVVSEIAATGGRARYWRCDVTDEEQVSTVVDEAEDWLGGLEGLVHSAGVMLGQRLPIHEVSPTLWRQVVEVNLTGAFLVVRRVAERMTQTRDGVIVLISSVGGVTTGSGSYAYGASKGGLHGLALSLDLHLSPLGVRVHEVCPDGMDTPLYRASMAEGIARGVDPREYEEGLGSPDVLAELIGALMSVAGEYMPLTIVARPRRFQ